MGSTPIWDIDQFEATCFKLVIFLGREEKAGSTAVLRRGRGNFQQKIICDRLPPGTISPLQATRLAVIFYFLNIK